MTPSAGDASSIKPKPEPRARRQSARRTGPLLIVDFLDNAVGLTACSFGRKASLTSPSRIWELPHDWSEAGQIEKSGRWLSERIQEMGFNSRRAILLVPRLMVSVRSTETPRVTDDELITLLELQVETESLTPFADLRWTFVRGGETSLETTLHPLLMTVPWRRVSPLLSLLEHAGLEVEAVTPRSVALAASNASLSVPRTETPSESVLVAEAGHETEIILTNGWGDLLASQSISQDPDEPPQSSTFDSDVRWANSVASRWNQSALALPRSDGLSSDLRCRMCVGVSREPVLRAALSNVAGFAPSNLSIISHDASECLDERPRPNRDSFGAVQLAAKGCLRLLETGKKLPDFADPPKITPPRTRRWRLAATLAAALAISTGWCIHSAQAKLDRQIQNLQQNERQLLRWIERSESVEALSAEIETWKSRQINARSELAEFLERIPESGEVVLSELAVSAASEGRAQLRARGASTSAEAALKLNERLIAAPARYELQPHPFRKSRRNDGYSVAFEIEAEMETSEQVSDDKASIGLTLP